MQADSEWWYTDILRAPIPGHYPQSTTLLVEQMELNRRRLLHGVMDASCDELLQDMIDLNRLSIGRCIHKLQFSPIHCGETNSIRLREQQPVFNRKWIASAILQRGSILIWKTEPVLECYRLEETPDGKPVLVPLPPQPIDES